jgi:hypothetical protein
LKKLIMLEGFGRILARWRGTVSADGVWKVTNLVRAVVPPFGP